MLFRSATRGFKSGGWNARGTAPVANQALDPEKVWSYEAGMRSEWADRKLRFNVTLFQLDVKGLQTPSAFVAPSGAISFITRNFAGLKNTGYEVELIANPVEGLSLFAFLGRQDAKYKDLAPSIVTQQQECLKGIAGQPGGVLARCNQGIVDPSGRIAKPVRTPDTLTVGGEAFDLRTYRRIFVVGAGKASAPMARATEDILGDRVTAGHVIVKVGYLDATTRVTLHEASHPVPDQAGIDGTAQLVTLLEGADEHDLVVCLISGGGSALMILPEDGISLEDYRSLTNALLRSGADITRINTIRKHVERVKGGRLAELASPATVVALVLSDVVGNPLDFIASGPTVPDPTTYADALQVLIYFDLEGKVQSGRAHV